MSYKLAPVTVTHYKIEQFIFLFIFVGDYFGILMDRRVTEFPFNICEDPMYVGSTLSFLGTSLM